MLVNLNEVLPKAKKEGYAVGLFNTVNLEMAKGVLAAAAELNAPVIIGTAEVLLPFASLGELAPMLIPLARDCPAPVVLHFDHGLTLPKIREAMDLGFTSVMYDCSALPYEENCEAVRKLTEEAHSRGVTVEAELGHVGSAGPDAGDGSVYTDPKEALDYSTRTGVDALAVAIGTAHGAYTAAPKLDIPRLREIAGLVEAPLVLHGGSGLSDDDFQSCIQSGVAKVNIFTDINCAAAQAAHDGWAPGEGMTGLMGGIVESVKAATIRKMRVFGCQGKG